MASYIKNNVSYYYTEDLYDGEMVRYEVPAVLNSDGSVDEVASKKDLEEVRPRFEEMFEMDKLYPQT